MWTSVSPWLTVKTAVEKVGDVIVTLAKRGNKGANDDKALAQDMCRVAVTLPVGAETRFQFSSTHTRSQINLSCSVLSTA
jgi:hypothetical protein